MKICPECQTENKQDARFCRGCGHEFVMERADPSATRRLPENEPDPSATRRLPESDPDPNSTRRLPESNPDPSATRRLPDAAPPPADPSATRRLGDVTPPPFPPQQPKPQPPPQAAPPPPPAYQPPPTYQQPKPAQKKSLLNNRQLLVYGGGALGVLALIGIIWAVARSLSGGGSYMLIGLPDRNGEIDLYTLRSGDSADDATALAEEMTLVDGWSYLTVYDDVDSFHSMNAGMGAFLVGDDQLFLFYRDGNDTFLQQVSARGGEPVTLLDSSVDLNVFVFPDEAMVGIVENRGSGRRCYVAPFGEEAIRVARGDNCFFANSAGTVYASEESGEDEFTLTAFDFDGENEVVLIESDEGRPYWQSSFDGSHIAYVEVARNGEEQLYFVDRSDGDTSAISEEFLEIYDFGFAEERDRLFYIGITDDGMAELYTTNGEDALIEAEDIAALLDKEGERVIYVAGEYGDELAVYVSNIDGSSETEIISGDEAAFALLEDEGRILAAEISDDLDIRIISSDLSGEDPVEIYDDDRDISDVYHVPGSDYLLIEIYEDEYTSLIVTDLNEENTFEVIEEFASVTVRQVAANDSVLVFTGREDQGDELILYSVELNEDAQPIELDDDLEGIDNVFITNNGRAVVYNARTGSSPDDVEIRQVNLDGEDPPEVLFEEARLFDVQWKGSTTPNSVDFYSP